MSSKQEKMNSLIDALYMQTSKKCLENHDILVNALKDIISECDYSYQDDYEALETSIANIQQTARVALNKCNISHS